MHVYQTSLFDSTKITIYRIKYFENMNFFIPEQTILKEIK